MVAIFLAALLPFAAKIAVLATGVTGYALQSLYKILQLVIPLAWHRKRMQVLFEPLHERPSVATMLLGIGVALAFSSIAALTIPHLASVFGLTPEQLSAGMAGRFDLTPITALLIVAFLAIFNAALEELHFRLWLDRTLSGMLGDIWGITISALLFGAMHALIFIGLPGFQWALFPVGIIGIAIPGAAWSMLLRRPGGIYAAWLSHALTDALFLTWGLWWLGIV